MSAEFIYLASGSPRRRALLRQIGVAFQLLKVTVDESALAGEEPEAYVSRLARSKAAAGAAVRPSLQPAPVLAADTAARPSLQPAPVLAADTAVVLDGQILGKPADAADAARMLLALSGRTHTVLTAIALASADGVQAVLSRSEVTFRAIAAAEARLYWDTGEACDKAGGYAIQGRAAVFVTDLKGSYSGVMGLPLYETAALLDAQGVRRWRPGSLSE
jgi:septum formation protein